MNDQQAKLPIWFWMISVAALVWNFFGVAAYIADVSQTPEAMTLLTEAQRNLYATRPAWAVGAFAIAVFAGVIGALLLLLRRSLASVFFIISLLALFVQNYYWFILAKVNEVYSGNVYAMPAVVVVVAIFLIWFARSSTGKGWLR